MARSGCFDRRCPPKNPGLDLHDRCLRSHLRITGPSTYGEMRAKKLPFSLQQSSVDERQASSNAGGPHLANPPTGPTECRSVGTLRRTPMYRWLPSARNGNAVSTPRAVFLVRPSQRRGAFGCERCAWYEMETMSPKQPFVSLAFPSAGNDKRGAPATRIQRPRCSHPRE